MRYLFALSQIFDYHNTSRESRISYRVARVMFTEGEDQGEYFEQNLFPHHLLFFDLTENAAGS